LSNSPSALITVFGEIFSDKSRFRNLIVYVDDICCFTSTWQGHLEQLELTLETLRQMNILLSPKKTEVEAQEVEQVNKSVEIQSI